MKLIHLSDLHLGKRVNGYLLMEDQKYILNEILNIIDAEAPDGVIIAGDLYDKTVPSAEAVELCDQFLVDLASRKLHIFLLSGNHDSAERVAFGGRLMELSQVHVSPVYSGTVTPITLSDEYGPVNVYLLPFVKPSHVRRYFPDADIQSYTDAIHTAVEAMGLDSSVRNVLVAHQFITNSEKGGSEEASVGGLDNVDSWVFDDFDYVALGHIHMPQDVTSKIRYCGSPLKYSFSEAKREKSVTVVELGEKGAMNVRTVPLKPLRDLVELRGTFNELTASDFYTGTTYMDDYTHITLTDEQDVVNGLTRLQEIYTHLMKMDYDNTRTRHHQELHPEEVMDIGSMDTALTLFAKFYQDSNGGPMNEDQSAYMETLFRKIWEEEV